MVQRSAAARAAESGVSTEDILTAWAGGAPAPAPTVAPAPAAEEPETEAPRPETEAPPAPAPEPEPVPAAFPAFEPAAVAVVETESPETELVPVPMGIRVRTAVRIGAWIGAALGLAGFLVATMSWAPAAIIPEEGASVAVETNPTTALIAIAAVSVVFGAIVAALSRAATSWRDPAMGLSSSKTSTAWIGAGIGLLLGVAAGGLLTGTFATPVGEDGAFVHLPVLATLTVMVVGGAALGAITAATPQLLGIPMAVAAEERQETEAVKSRLAATVGVPLTGLVILVALVLPFAYILLQSNHLTSNGAALVAVIAAGGILGFAALSGNRPHMRIRTGELLVAVVGIGTVLLLVLAVLVFSSDEHPSEDEDAAETTAAVQLL